MYIHILLFLLFLVAPFVWAIHFETEYWRGDE